MKHESEHKFKAIKVAQPSKPPKLGHVSVPPARPVSSGFKKDAVKISVTIHKPSLPAPGKERVKYRQLPSRQI